MRKVEVKSNGREVMVYVGTVDQNGNYDVLKLTPAEAAVLMVKLEQAI